MYIVSILIDKREEQVPGEQAVLTKYGKNIIARLGLHKCKDGSNLVVVVYDAEDVEEFVEELNSAGNVNVNYMEA